MRPDLYNYGNTFYPTPPTSPCKKNETLKKKKTFPLVTNLLTPPLGGGHHM